MARRRKRSGAATRGFVAREIRDVVKLARRGHCGLAQSRLALLERHAHDISTRTHAALRMKIDRCFRG